MIKQKKVSVGQFAKKGEDIKDGDIVKVKNAGVDVPGEFGIQSIFLIELTNGEEKNMSFNQTSMNNLIDVWGEDTDKWVGKEIKAWINRENVAGKFQLVAYFTHPNGTLENPFPLDGA